MRGLGRKPAIRWMEYQVMRSRTVKAPGALPCIIVLGAPRPLRPDGSRGGPEADVPDRSTGQALGFGGSAVTRVNSSPWPEVPFRGGGPTSFIAGVTNESHRDCDERGGHFESTRGGLQTRQLDRRLGVHLELDCTTASSGGAP